MSCQKEVYWLYREYNVYFIHHNNASLNNDDCKINVFPNLPKTNIFKLSINKCVFNI